MSLGAAFGGRLKSSQRQIRHNRPSLESLEDRVLLSLSSLGSTALLGEAFDPHRILVQFRPEAESAGLVKSNLAGTSVGGEMSLVPGLHQVQLADGISLEQALTAYRSSPYVLYAEAARPLHLTSVTPSDTSFGSQWDLNNSGQSGGARGADIHATDAWTVTTGSGKTVVAVIDTGVDYNHPDLYLNIWVNQREIPQSRLKNLIDVNSDGLINFRDLNDARNQGTGKITDINKDGRIDASDILAPMTKDSRGQDTGLGGWADGISEDGDIGHVDDLVGWNFVANTNNPYDDNNHGTHVSGTIGAIGNNSRGVAGINWQVQIMALKFLDASGSGYDSDAVDAINYAVTHGAGISNNSWGGGGNDQSLYNAIAGARRAGHIVVAAAGNDGANNDITPSYPANYRLDNVVAVAATDRYDRLASFSNYGAATVALAAPGVSILSTIPNASYAYFSGTSMATPHVTGVLALVRDLHPDWTYKQVIDQVVSTVDPLSGLRGKTISGGRLNAAAAVKTNVTPTPNPSPAPTPTLTADEAFVQKLYQDLLGRSAEASALDSWSFHLATDMSRQQVAQVIWVSPEHRGRQVNQFYVSILHRTADSAGRQAWVSAFQAGASEEAVQLGLLNSGEYQSQHANVTSFISGLYQDVLGRNAGSAELNTWVQALQSGMTRAQAAHMFLNSDEKWSQFIRDNYLTFLNRTPDGTAQAVWLNQFRAGLINQAALSLAILSSNEYYSLASS